MKKLLWLLPLLVSACAEYNSHVASRSDTLSGFSKDSNVGGALTHTVTYR